MGNNAPNQANQAVLGTPPSGKWLGAKPNGGDPRMTYGAVLAQKLSEGLVSRAPSEYVSKVRDSVTEACEELVSIGARIRPLMVEGVQIGWVRGFHDPERRALRRWVPNSVDFMHRCLLLSTSLSEDEVDSLPSPEVGKLVRLVVAMSDRDATLFPYLSAFSTTRESEALWHSGGKYACFENRVVSMPDGKKITILCPSAHARLWASLCTYREQAKKRVDESWNAVLIMRPWAGKSVDGLANELKMATKQLQANSLEPWENIVAAPPERALEDGWAHVENMETREGMMRELHGMLNNDRHEQLMAKFEQQQLQAAERRRQQIEELVMRHGGPGVGEKGGIRVLTEEEATKSERAMRQGKALPPPISGREGAEVTLADSRERIRKYS